MKPGESRIDFLSELKDGLPCNCPQCDSNEFERALEEWAHSIASRVEEQTIQRMCGDGHKPFPRLYGSAPDEKRGK